jgi:hypothetical protein
LLRFARHDAEVSAPGSSTTRKAGEIISRNNTGPRNAFFIFFVDGMFTTFIARLFTKTSRACTQMHAISCLLRARHAD